MTVDREEEIAARVAGAVQLLGQDCDRAAVESAVKKVYQYQNPGERVREAGVIRAPAKQAEKRAIARTAKLLDRYIAALKNAPDYVQDRCNLVEQILCLADLREVAPTALTRSKGRHTRDKQSAVEQAALLLQQQRVPLTATRRGRWDRLAAILLGKPDSQLIHYIEAYLKAAKKRLQQASNSPIDAQQ